MVPIYFTSEFKNQSLIISLAVIYLIYQIIDNIIFFSKDKGDINENKFTKFLKEKTGFNFLKGLTYEKTKRFMEYINNIISRTVIIVLLTVFLLRTNNHIGSITTTMNENFKSISNSINSINNQANGDLLENISYPTIVGNDTKASILSKITEGYNDINNIKSDNGYIYYPQNIYFDKNEKAYYYINNKDENIFLFSETQNAIPLIPTKSSVDGGIHIINNKIDPNIDINKTIIIDNADRLDNSIRNSKTPALVYINNGPILVWDTSKSSPSISYIIVNDHCFNVKDNNITSIATIDNINTLNKDISNSKPNTNGIFNGEIKFSKITKNEVVIELDNYVITTNNLVIKDNTVLLTNNTPVSVNGKAI